MKKLVIILVLIVSVLACKNETKPEVNLEEQNRAKSYDVNDGYITMRGEFVYYADAAVFQTSNDIYGVVIDENMHLLNETAKPFKTADTDGVMVTARVKKIKKPEGEEGWPFSLEIKEILKVEATKKSNKDVIKLSN
ncbi:hypothetical protein [uncultured Winogradskyella sp.]|uniref:hypothetical protein n=1 Tax=uncultured Winogradskyella sp. TaxID=395353 RepID=UPI00262A2ABF|nr:hypothetical protein [uncultured Winogradskyella sp.]